MFNPGSMRTKVVIASRTITTDAGGHQKPTYTTLVAEVWANWKNVHGQEAIVADANGVKMAATVIVRYRSDIVQTCGIWLGATVAGSAISGGDLFEIISMDNIEQRNEYIELKVKRITGG